MNNVQSILDQVYAQMLPQFGSFIGIAQALGALGSLWYIAYRVWGHIARAEGVDIYPLLRPFALSLAIAFYTPLLGMFNGALQPMVTGSAAILQGSNTVVAALIQNREEQGTGLQDELENQVDFSVSKLVMEGLTQILEVVFYGAYLIIGLIRTFILIVLSMVGPLVIGISSFDAFRHSLQHWLARYINVFLWLPVANIYGSIIGQVEQLMLQQNGQTPEGLVYILFLMMGIVGYCCVPSTANYIVQASGGHPLMGRVTRFIS